MRTNVCEMSVPGKADSGANFVATGDAPKPVVENEDDLDYLTAD